jgi:hypothetical protein
MDEAELVQGMFWSQKVDCSVEVEATESSVTRANAEL